MYLTYDEGKYVVAERFLTTSKKKIYNYLTWISRNVYINKKADIFNECNITYSMVQMKPADVKSSMYIDFGVENNVEDPKFEVDDHVRIFKYENIFAKGHTPN